MTRIVGYTRLEALYRVFLGMDLDKGRSEEIIDVASSKLVDLFRAGLERAYARGSDIVEWIDLPLTLALKETINWYRRERERLNDPRLDLKPIIDYLEAKIAGLVIGDTVRENLQDLTATMLLLLGRIIKLVDPKVKKPSKEDINKAKQILDLTI
ncbi:MAG: DUF1931 family protein [Desulfurococcales archaeon]|nr:DUF1931 family protein [Desulfurococcales archaeon]